jgi:hypothetical protein
MCFKYVLPSFDVLLAASKLYKVQVFVYFWSEQPVIYRCGDFEDVIHLQCLGGVHFNALVPLQNFKDPECNLCTQVNCDTPFQKYVSHGGDDLSDDSGGEEQYVKNLLNVNTVVNDSNVPCAHNTYNITQPQVKVIIGKFEFCALVDTGAELSLVSDKVLTQLKDNSVPFIVKSEHWCDLIGLSGVKTPVTRTAMLKVSPGNMNIDNLFKFAVVPESIFPQCFLIGLDFLYNFNINVNLNERILTDKSGAIAKMPFNSCYGPLEKCRDMLCLTRVSNPGDSSHKVNIFQSVSDTRMELVGDDKCITGLQLLLSEYELTMLQNNDPILKAVKSCITDLVPTNKWSDNCKEFIRYNNKLTIMNDI